LRAGEKKGGKYDSELEQLTFEREFLAEPRATVTEKGHPKNGLQLYIG
jgi:hypothetical protein